LTIALHRALLDPGASGHFFNFPRDGFLVLSLITHEHQFREGAARLRNFFEDESLRMRFRTTRLHGLSDKSPSGAQREGRARLSSRPQFLQISRNRPPGISKTPKAGALKGLPDGSRIV